MIKIRPILRLLTIAAFCFAMTIAFWSTSGGWTQTYLNNLFDNGQNDSNVTNVHYSEVAQAAPLENYRINIVDDRSSRKIVHFNNSVNKRVVILRLDDVQAFAWRNISIKITDSVLERNMSITLGVIPRNIKDDNILFEYLQNVSSDNRIEIAQHGVNHSSDEYMNVNEDNVFNMTKHSLDSIAEISGKYPVTMIPPYNVIGGINVSIALSRLGFNMISGDYGVFNYNGYTMNIGYSTTTGDDNGSLVPIDAIISNCNMALNKTGVCVITIHPQDYATDKGLLDTEKFSKFIELLNVLKGVDAKSITFADLSKDEYVEGDIINNTEPIQHGNVGKWDQYYIYSEDGVPSSTFGSCDCDRLKVLKYMLPTGDNEQNKRINYLIDRLVLDYNYYTVDEMWNYCARSNYNMSSPI